MIKKPIAFKLKLAAALTLATAVAATTLILTSKKLTTYSCREGAAFMCTTDNDICKKEDFKSEFLVNKETRSVLMITYYQSGPSDSTTLKGCTIFDDKNWDCSESMPNGYGVLITFAHKMANGTYTYSLTRSDDYLDKRYLYEKNYLDFCAKL